MPSGASAVSFYIPVSPSSSISCEIGAAGANDVQESGGNTSFGENLVLGGGGYNANEGELGDIGHASSCVNFSDTESTPWGLSNKRSPEIGYGVEAAWPGYGANSEAKPGLLIIEYVNNKDTVVLTESQTITVPLGVTGALVSGCGAGGGKISLTRAPAPDSMWASGAGGSIINYYVPLNAGESIECIVGDANASFGDGGDTKFGNYLTLGGGKAGAINTNGATGTVPSGVNFSKDSVVSAGGYTPFGRTSYYDDSSTYHEAMGYGAGSNGYEVGEPSSSLPGLLIIQWVK